MSDNLESYFKKHLTDQTPGSDEWNIPSDDVWQNVAPKIGRRKGLFIPWKYFYFLAAGLALIIAAVLFFPKNRNEFQAEKNRISALEAESAPSKMADSTEEIAHSRQKENERDKANNESLKKDTESNQKLENINVKNHSIVESTAIVASANNKDSPPQNLKTETSAPINESNKVIKTGNGINQSGKSNPEIVVASAGSNQSKGVSDNFDKPKSPDYATVDKFGAPIFIYSDPVYSFPVNEGYIPLKGQNYLNNQKANPIPFSQGKFGIGAYYAPTYSTTMVKGLTLQGGDQMGNTFLFSNNWGIDFYYYLSNRFTLVSGVGSYEIRSWSKTTNQFGYDPSTEHDMGNNQTANGTSQSSSTPFGSMETEVIYSFPSDANIPDGEIMESVSETFQNVRYLTIPLGVEYNFLKREKGLLFLETGINYNVSMRDKTELKPQVLHQGDEMNIMESTIVQSPDYENNYWGFYIGTGLKFPVSTRIQLLGTLRYNRSISPLKSIGDASTNVQAYQFKLGVVYLLH